MADGQRILVLIRQIPFAPIPLSNSSFHRYNSYRWYAFMLTSPPSPSFSGASFQQISSISCIHLLLDSDDDSTDSSSHFDPVDADFTGSSWENDGVFPQDMDDRRLSSSYHRPSNVGRIHRSNSSSRVPPTNVTFPPSPDVKVPAQLPNETCRPTPPTREENFGVESKPSNGNVALACDDLEKLEPGTRAARLSELQHMGMRLYDQCCRAQAGNWTFLSRFLPRFV